ncbi:SpoIIE family protein phosphatase [Streptomyces morookaense]|uniref:ATP-binding SpoIIE family protein phosphatase n=1 Tax=Streptomyces morookaense TaxID=1970 RepID=UPI0033D9B024
MSGGPGRRPRRWMPHAWSVATQAFVLQVAVVLLLVAAVAVEWVYIARDDALHEARDRSLSVAEGFANSPGIVAALHSADPTAVLQPRAETARKRSDVDFLIVMNTDGIRYTAPDPGLIGKKFIGTIAPALEGRSFTEKIDSPRGPVVQAVVPVTGPGNTVAGLVCAGEAVHGLSGHVSRRLPFLFGAAAVALAVAVAGNALISRRLRRQTHGLGTAELGRMYEHLKLLYDASTAVGTTLDVRRTAQELAHVAVPAFADTVTVDLAEAVVHGGEPDPADDVRLLRAARGGIDDGRSPASEGETVAFAPSTPQSRALREGQACLLSSPQADGPLIAAPLAARGTTLGVVSFLRSRTAQPFAHDDLSAAGELCSRAAVSIDNARRYTREHTMAVTLQRSLLPGVLPEHGGVEVASGYLPALGGVGGDWFDVIPLPGLRVALVVGDVVGRGLHAAATMGRLRTAVHNFSALDVPPEELLAHLDELVTRIDEGTQADGGTPVTGATCLYAVYDPTCGRCTLARAGHPPPAVLRPDGRVEFPDVPVGPPLGVGGLPFEAAELDLPESSRLVLYTDGLVRGADHDLSGGMRALGDTLASRAGRTPQETCDAVLHALAPQRPRDDVALLVARTRLLEPGRIAAWDVPADPAAVAQVRNAAVRTLAEWGLDELSFTTELILSELITNAVRYAAAPIRLRMLRGGGSLVCEVSDASSTAPHLRYAATTDEGGRGLFLVAQLADRWGTRYTATGKIIWSEQALPDTGPGSA